MAQGAPTTKTVASERSRRNLSFVVVVLTLTHNSLQSVMGRRARGSAYKPLPAVEKLTFETRPRGRARLRVMR